ncbi:hypothetical protein GCM10022406_17550 [Hymenobacter algoricola]|uniref:DUF4468 domain-containing protein n=1 Tax=Hymenobacter algoricola TaxID=486267 RepID=A0ABP7MZ92_9BACT
MLLLATAFTARAQTQPWPKNEYGQVVFEGAQAVAATEAEATRKQIQQRVLAWFSSHCADGRAANGGKLSGRGEFNGWGSLPALPVGQHTYRFRLGVGTYLRPDTLAYRIGEIQCVVEQNGKPRSIPLEELLKSRNPEQQQALAAFRKQLDEFVKSL